MKSAMQELIDELESINNFKYKGTITSSNTIVMKEQTAIEWLIEQCPRIETIVAYNILEQAKQMEKEQILNDYMKGVDAGILYSNGKVFISKEEYYNRTYSQDRELGKEVTDLLENYKKNKNKL